jgi:hypothetical protein
MLGYDQMRKMKSTPHRYIIHFNKSEREQSGRLSCEKADVIKKATIFEFDAGVTECYRPKSHSSYDGL